MRYPSFLFYGDSYEESHPATDVAGFAYRSAVSCVIRRVRPTNSKFPYLFAARSNKLLFVPLHTNCTFFRSLAGRRVCKYSPKAKFPYESALCSHQSASSYSQKTVQNLDGSMPERFCVTSPTIILLRTNFKLLRHRLNC